MEGVLSRTLAVTDTLKEILSGVSEQEIEAVLQELLRVKRENKKVYTIAAGRANLIMRTFAMRLMQIGFRSYVVLIPIPPLLKPEICSLRVPAPVPRRPCVSLRDRRRSGAQGWF